MEAISRTAWNNNEVSIKALQKKVKIEEREKGKSRAICKRKKLMCKRNSDYVYLRSPAFRILLVPRLLCQFKYELQRNVYYRTTWFAYFFVYIYYLFFILIFINSRSSPSSLGSDSFSRAAGMYNNCLHAMQIREGYLPWVSRPNVDYLTWIN